MTDLAPAFLPHSLEHERTVLNAALEGGRVAEDLAASDFYLPEHAAIWTRILEAQRHGLSPEYQIVRHLLIEHQQLDAVGAGYLIDLSAGGALVSKAALASVVQLLIQLRRQRDAAQLVLRYAAKPADVNLELLDRDLQALRIAHGVGASGSFRTARELATAAAHVEWVMPGYLAIGAITELTGAAKRAGKTTIDKVSVHVPDPELDVWTEKFVVLGDSDAVAHDEAREALERHLPGTEGAALKMAELESVTGINRATLTRALKGMTTVKTIGKGGKGDPLRYYRPEVDCVQTSIPQGTLNTKHKMEVRPSGDGYKF